MIYDDILQVVGGTPTVRLNRIGEELGAELFAKCEFLNPGGSLKDRIAVRILDALEAEGRLSPGAQLIEPTSGNTGIGLAMAAAVRGYRLTVTIAQKISLEKEAILKALGAEVLRATVDGPYDHPEAQFGKALALSREIAGAVMPNQYANPENVNAHYHGTAAEIYEDFGDTLDAIVLGVGTAGTIMGVSRYFKERSPETLIVGVEPVGSLLGGATEVAPYTVEGIGYDWIPDIFDAKAVDRFLSVNDKDTYRMARRLIREEGLLVGGSAGAVGQAMLEIAAELPPGARILGLLGDGIRNYLTKFPSDDWLRERDLLDED